jgi:hypothetical protein
VTWGGRRRALFSQEVQVGRKPSASAGYGRIRMGLFEWIWDRLEQRSGITDDERALAGTWIAPEIARLRAFSYEELRAMEAQSSTDEEMRADDGRTFVRNVMVAWDRSGERRDLRVTVAVFREDGGFAVAVDDFIRAPDGSFVG